MASKRKRSGPIFSPNEAITHTTMFAQRNEVPIGLPLFFPQSKPIDTTRLDISRDCKFEPEEEEEGESSYLNSRTRKRYRDNRPDEGQIHANTMHKLYDAQKIHHHHHDHQQHPIPSQPQHQHQQQQQQHHQQRSTLHSFWHLPNTYRSAPQDQPPPVPPPQPSSSSSYPNLTCEDCDRPLFPPASTPTTCTSPSASAMDLDMAAVCADEALLDEQVACKGCGRLVCGFCAVVTDVRRCLGCVCA